MDMGARGIGGRLAETHTHRNAATGVEERCGFAQYPTVDAGRDSLKQVAKITTLRYLQYQSSSGLSQYAAAIIGNLKVLSISAATAVNIKIIFVFCSFLSLFVMLQPTRVLLLQSE